MGKSAGAKKRRKQKGVGAIFSSTDESKNARKPTEAATGKGANTGRSIRFAAVQTLFIVFLLFWLVFAYENDPNFRTNFNETFSYYFSPMALMAIGTTGLVLSIGWLIVNYQQDRKRLANPLGETTEDDLDDLRGLG